MTARHLRNIRRARLARPIPRAHVTVLDWPGADFSWTYTGADTVNVALSGPETGLGATNSGRADTDTDEAHAVALERERIAAIADRTKEGQA